jgi:hypothetical protein
VHALGGAPWDTPELRRRLDDLVASGAPFEDVEIAREGDRRVVISARPLRDVGGRTDLVLVAFQA